MKSDAGDGLVANDVLVALGENIRRQRKLRCMTQELLAQKAGLHRTYLSDVERGIRNPSILCITWIAAALDTSISEITKAIAIDQVVPALAQQMKSEQALQSARRLAR